MEILALSSGESELGAMVKSGTEGLGVQSLLADFDLPVQVKLLSDSTAAIGMVRRLGLGRVRHLATADLWLQQGVRNGSFTVSKHPTATNGADLMTKVKGRDDLFKLLGIIGFGYLPGRAEIAPARSQTWDVTKIVSCGNHDLGTSGLDVDYVSCNYSLGVDGDCWESSRSNVVHHYPSTNTFIEGRRLNPHQAMPPPTDRILTSVFDMNSGKELWNGAGSEPNLRILIADDKHPFLLLHWVVVQ